MPVTGYGTVDIVIRGGRNTVLQEVCMPALGSCDLLPGSCRESHPRKCLPLPLVKSGIGTDELMILHGLYMSCMSLLGMGQSYGTLCPWASSDG
jgi:hypothetical protein